MNKPIIQESIIIPFKGARNYVYASDVFQQIIGVLNTNFPNKEIAQIDFSTHKMASSNLEIFVYDNLQNKTDDIQAMFNFTVDGKNYYCIIKETGDPINSREEYPEEKLYKTFNLDFDKKTIYTTEKYDYSTLDIYTSMNKLLLTNLFSDNTTGWLSVRVKINKIFAEDYKKLTVKFYKNFASRYFCSNLFIDEIQIGQLFFSIK